MQRSAESIWFIVFGRSSNDYLLTELGQWFKFCQKDSLGISTYFFAPKSLISGLQAKNYLSAIRVSLGE
jgi:hypothetical protein